MSSVPLGAPAVPAAAAAEGGDDDDDDDGPCFSVGGRRVFADAAAAAELPPAPAPTAAAAPARAVPDSPIGTMARLALLVLLLLP